MIQIFNEFDGKLYNRAWDLARADRFCPPNLAKMCRETHVAVADLDAFMDGYTGTASKIHLFFPNHEEKLKAAALLQGLPFFVSESVPNDIEVMPLGVDKGTGLSALAAYLNLTPAEVMAVGDGENDLAMLRYAGLSVAMGNACDTVKKTARVVTETNDEDGLAKAVERVLRGNGHELSHLHHRGRHRPLGGDPHVLWYFPGLVYGRHRRRRRHHLRAHISSRPPRHAHLLRPGHQQALLGRGHRCSPRHGSSRMVM